LQKEIKTLIMSNKIKSVFEAFKKDFIDIHPDNEGCEKFLVRPENVYSKKTLTLNRDLGIHKLNKKQNDKVRKVS
jgi:hypothetical protein